MKVLKVLGNIIGVLLSIVVSLALLLTLIAAPAFTSVSNLVQTETLQSVAKNIDLSTILPDDPTTTEDDFVFELLETDMAGELIDMYIDDILAAMDGNAQSSLTVDEVKVLAEEHMDELLPIMRKAMGNVDGGVSDQELKDAILSYIDESGHELIMSLPTPEDLGIDVETTMALSLLRSNILRTGVIVLIAILSILILLLRWPRFKGFMWVAVVYILGALFALISGASISAILPGLVLSAEPMLAGVLTPVLAVLSKGFFTVAAVLGVLAIVFILIFAFGRKALKKRKAKRTAAAEAAAPAEPVAPAAESVAAAIPSYVTEGAAAAAESAAEPVAENVAEPEAAEPAAEAEPEL